MTADADGRLAAAMAGGVVVAGRRKVDTTTRDAEPRTGAWRAAFLAALRGSANVKAACRAAGVSRTIAYRTRNEQAKFRADWDEVLADALDALEALAWERALAGDDRLVIFLLKAHRPTVYGDAIAADLPPNLGAPIMRNGDA